MRKLLILTDSFGPPLWAPRVRNLAINLQKRGWEVLVVAEILPQWPYSTSEYNVKFFHYYQKGGLADRFRWLLDQCFLVKERCFQRFVERNCDVDQYDAILCSSFNLFPLLSSQRLAKKHHKPLSVDLRDITEQWGNGLYLYKKQGVSGLIQKVMKQAYESRIIRRRDRVLRGAECVTTVSPWHLQFLLKKNSTTKLIYNGFDENMFYAKDVVNEEFRIVYTGKTFFDIRDPQLLFEALQELQNPEIVVEWYTDENGQRMVGEYAKKYGVEAQMRCRDYVPNEEVPALLQSSSIVLVLTNKETEQGPHGIMTTKFFEALGVEKPVLCVRSDESCLAQAIEETNAGVAAKNVDEVKAFILEKYSEWKEKGFTHQLVNQEIKRCFSRQYQAKQFEEILNNLIESKE